MPKNYTTMAHLRNFVVKSVNDGNSLKTILKKVKNNGKATKRDLMKAIMWWALWWLAIIITVILWVICCSVIAAVCSVIAAVVMLMTSPVWMPIRLWKAPEKVAKLLLNTEYKEWDKPEESPFVIGSNVWYGGVKVINWAWKPIYNRLPMSHRQWFIDEDDKELESYPTEVQVAYYDEQKSDNKESTMRHMSNEAMDCVWYRGELKDRENCLNSWNLVLWKYKLLFENEDKEQFNLLMSHCANKEKQVDGKLQCYFVEQLVGEHNQRAYEVLLVCADVNDRTLENKTLTDLISMLGSEHGEQAHEVLYHYWEKHTLPAEVVEALIKAATESFVDDGKRRAYKLLKELASRNDLTTELAELFFSRCDSVENDEMTEILNERMDYILINRECVSVDDKDQVKKLTDYFTIRENVSVEGQKLLREWQYVLYRRTNHKLDAEAISYLLVKCLKESDVSFFMQVLDEAGDELSEKDVKLMVLTPWKRDILIERFAKAEKNKGVGTV